MTLRILLLSLGLLVAASPAVSQRSGSLPPYHVVHGWPQLPFNAMLNEVSAVAVDSHDHVLVLTRGGRKWPDEGPMDTTAIDKPTVLVFDGKSGRLISKWPNRILALPHSITVDDQDNVWITDVAWHQVLKFSHDGKPLKTLGQRGVAGEDAKHFNKPSDVAVSRDGTMYVSDGYGNNRIVKVGADGAFMKLLKSAQAVRVAPDGRVYVACAGEPGANDRTGVVIFDVTGKVIQKVGRFGNYDGQFVDLHWLALSGSGALYTADFEGRRVLKFIR